MKALIIGGGIGGLTTAIALQKKGIDFELFEQAHELAEVGAGLWVAANAQQVFERLGILPAVAGGGKDLEIIKVVDTNYKTISSIDCNEVKKNFGYGTLAFHRAELHKRLLAQLPEEKIHTSRRFTGIGADDDESKAIALFDDGKEASGDIIICADGIKSAGRRFICPEVRLRYSGQTCWRFVADFKLPGEHKNNMHEMWGSTKGLRAAWSHINETQVYCYITNYEKSGGKDNRGTLKADLHNLLKEFPEPVQVLIDSADENKIIRSDLYDFCAIPAWHKKRLVLLGDAAHATTPNLGQGACQAVESAYVLANCLSTYKTHTEAFQAYEHIRRPKTKWITQTSWRLGQITNSSGFTKKMLEFFMRNAPKSVARKQMDKMYKLDF